MNCLPSFPPPPPPWPSQADCKARSPLAAPPVLSQPMTIWKCSSFVQIFLPIWNGQEPASASPPPAIANIHPSLPCGWISLLFISLNYGSSRFSCHKNSKQVDLDIGKLEWGNKCTNNSSTAAIEVAFSVSMTCPLADRFLYQCNCLYTSLCGDTYSVYSDWFILMIGLCCHFNVSIFQKEQSYSVCIFLTVLGNVSWNRVRLHSFSWIAFKSLFLVFLSLNNLVHYSVMK